MLINYDSGAIPSCLLEISEEFHLSYSSQGMLGSLVGFFVFVLLLNMNMRLVFLLHFLKVSEGLQRCSVALQKLVDKKQSRLQLT